MDLGSGGLRADTLARAMTDASLPERLARAAHAIVGAAGLYDKLRS